MATGRLAGKNTNAVRGVNNARAPSVLFALLTGGTLLERSYLNDIGHVVFGG